MRELLTGFKSLASRRSFFKKGLTAGTASMSALLSGNSSPLFGQASKESGKLTQGDAAILRFLAAAEILESDLWEQYWDRHRGGGHPPTPATPPYVRVRIRRFEMVTSAFPRTMSATRAI